MRGRKEDGGVEWGGGPSLAKVICGLIVSKEMLIFGMDWGGYGLARIFAPRENPTAISGRFGNFRRMRLTMCLISLVYIALNILLSRFDIS